MERTRIQDLRPRSRWRRVAAAALVLLVASVVPSPLRRRPAFATFGPDKALHFAGHAAFATLLADALDGGGRSGRTTAVLSFGVSTAYSLMTGHLQRWVPGRAPERADVVAAVLGSVAGLLVWRRASEGAASRQE